MNFDDLLEDDFLDDLEEISLETAGKVYPGDWVIVLNGETTEATLNEIKRAVASNEDCNGEYISLYMVNSVDDLTTIGGKVCDVKENIQNYVDIRKVLKVEGKGNELKEAGATRTREADLTYLIHRGELGLNISRDYYKF